MDVFELTREQYRIELEQRTTPEEVFANVDHIYDFLSEIFGQTFQDSLIREWTFQWFCDETGEPYDKIYDKWLEAA